MDCKGRRVKDYQSHVKDPFWTAAEIGMHSTLSPGQMCGSLTVFDLWDQRWIGGIAFFLNQSMHNGSLCCFQTNEAVVTPTAQAKSRRPWWSQLAVAKIEFVSANEGFDDINNADSEEARKIKDLCVCGVHTLGLVEGEPIKLMQFE